MSPALLEQLSNRPLTKVIDGVALVAEGSEHWLAPVGAWLADSTDLAVVADTLRPTVLRIRVESEDGGGGGATGFVLRGTGLVVTNAHVVEKAAKVEVATDGGEWVPGRVHAVASDTDLALIEVDSSIDLPVVRLGTSSDLSIGTRVFTLGFPKLLDGDPTFSSGEVTAARRFVTYGAGQMEVVQTSYAATGGASGSPVFDSSGVVIGIHQGGAEADDDQRAADYLSFAVPVDALRRWLTEIGELTDGATPPPLRLRSGSESELSLKDPQTFLNEVAEAGLGTIARDHGGDSAAFKSLSIVDKTLTGWEAAEPIRFLAPFRTGGCVVEAAAPQPAPRPDEVHAEDPGLAADANDLI
nr:serine protease [Rhabdothermincola salaria]